MFLTSVNFNLSSNGINGSLRNCKCYCLYTVLYIYVRNFCKVINPARQKLLLFTPHTFIVPDKQFGVCYSLQIVVIIL